MSYLLIAENKSNPMKFSWGEGKIKKNTMNICNNSITFPYTDEIFGMEANYPQEVNDHLPPLEQ